MTSGGGQADFLDIGSQGAAQPQYRLTDTSAPGVFGLSSDAAIGEGHAPFWGGTSGETLNTHYAPTLPHFAFGQTPGSAPQEAVTGSGNTPHKNHSSKVTPEVFEKIKALRDQGLS
ncbi:hypothetical protein ABLN87_22275, partial [Ruegeria sp. SCPT10]|uniref:hypothetical protein n=1 Tax=Ruegeria sp. SCP10 TaxID=3141377 RepID=UPI0033390FDE